MSDPKESDIDSAQEISSYEHGDRTVDGWVETLYKTEDGRFFVWFDTALDSDHGGAIFGEWRTDEEARVWLEEHSTPDTIKEHLG